MSEAHSTYGERLLAEVAAYRFAEREPRTEQLIVRLSVNEKRELVNRARAMGTTLSQFTRERVLG